MKTITVEIEVPDWARWIATDEDGDINVYRMEPNIDGVFDDEWLLHDDDDDDGWVCIGKDFANPNWRDSLKEIK